MLFCESHLRSIKIKCIRELDLDHSKKKGSQRFKYEFLPFVFKFSTFIVLKMPKIFDFELDQKVNESKFDLVLDLYLAVP